MGHSETRHATTLPAHGGTTNIIVNRYCHISHKRTFPSVLLHTIHSYVFNVKHSEDCTVLRTRLFILVK